MCGIVGMVSKNGNIWGDLDDVFQDMLYVDGIRGMDSTGAFTVTAKNQVEVVKQGVDPGVFFNTNTWKNFKKTINRSTIVVGHNRKATFGSVNTKNAHPFVDKGMILVHNGWIGNSRQIDSSREVDSEAIITALDKEKNYLEGLKSLVGAFAIVWYNHNNKTLYLTRNKERPLWIAHSSNMMFFASEGMMLEWLLRRRTIAHEVPRQLEEHQVLEVTLNPFTIKEQKIPFTIPVFRSPIAVPWKTEVDFEPAFDLTGRPSSANEPTHDEYIDTAHRAKSLLKVYPPDSLVLFQPKGMSEAGKDMIIVHGHAWYPGKDAVKANYLVKKENDDEGYLNMDVPLVAHVQAMSSRNTDLWMIVKDVRRPHEIFKDWNGQLMGAEEWHAICERWICDRCAKNPQSHQPDYTMINRKDPGKYEVVCGSCLDEITDNHTHVPADDKTDKPSING